MCLTQRHAGCGDNMPQPVFMVQCSGISSEKGWNSALLCGFLQAQCIYQKGLIPLMQIQEALESMVGTAHFSTMEFSSRFWKVRMVQSPNSIPPSWLEIWDSTSLLICPLGSATPPQLFNASCRTPWKS